MINMILFFDLNQLVYVDSADQCNDLGFNIGGGASTITRAWTIKVFDLFYNPWTIFILDTKLSFFFWQSTILRLTQITPWGWIFGP